jgi:asparagine synthase (glutamine-hydrolysing)
MNTNMNSCLILVQIQEPITFGALSRQIQSGGLRTYSIAFEEKDWDEGAIAGRVAERFETEHTEFKIGADLGRELLGKFLQAIDRPSVDGFNSFCVSHIARQDGTKVTLSGLGGDELFAGYPSFQRVPQMVNLGRKLGGFRHLLGMGLERWGKSAKMRRLGDFLREEPTTVRAYRSFRGIFSHREAIAILKHYLPDLPERIELPEPLALPATSVEDEVAYLELSLYLRNQLLQDSDVTSMASSLELRVPLMDRVLLEAIAPISSSVRLLPGKQLLVRAVPELPEWVVNRPKQGFAFPLEKWFATDWQDLFSRPSIDPDIPLTPWSRRWSLGILQHWWESISK